MKYILLTTCISWLFFSCLPCSNLDCLTDNYNGQFRIVSAADGRDLVFGPASVYNKDQIKFYALRGADTTFFNCEAIKFPNTGYDSILYVRFFPKADMAFIRLSNSDIDTLNITYNTFDTKCCGTITEVTNFRFNNRLDIPGNKGTQEIKK